MENMGTCLYWVHGYGLGRTGSMVEDPELDYFAHVFLSVPRICGHLLCEVWSVGPSLLNLIYSCFGRCFKGFVAIPNLGPMLLWGSWTEFNDPACLQGHPQEAILLLIDISPRK